MKLRLSAALLLTLSLSGCFSYMLWGEDTQYIEKTTSYKIADTDRITTFGIAKEDRFPLEKGSLVMMGEKYWFAVNPKESQALLEILNVKLDRQFELAKPGSAGIRTRYKALPVFQVAPNKADFASQVCLSYQTADAQDIAKLTKLSFQSSDGKNYSRCVSADGKYFVAPKNRSSDYRFEKSIPVEIRYPVDKTGFKGGKLARNIFLTPFALAGDALGGILFLPMYIDFKKGPW